MQGKSWRNDRNDGYADTYAADLDYNLGTEDSYDDWKFPKDGFATGYSDRYAEFASPRSMTGRSWKERPSQNARYSRNIDVPFMRGNRASRERNERTRWQRENTYPLWFANDDERNTREARNIDVRSKRVPVSEHRRRTRIFPGTDDFNRDFGQFSESK